jgi:hypothetical protein
MLRRVLLYKYSCEWLNVCGAFRESGDGEIEATKPKVEILSE